MSPIMDAHTVVKKLKEIVLSERVPDWFYEQNAADVRR